MDSRSAALAFTAVAMSTGLAHAQAPLLTGLGGPVGFGTDALLPDDDNSSASIPIGAAFPSGLEFFGARYTDLFVNNNGNVSFDMPLTDFTPEAFPVAAQPMIAPWWGDVDTRGVAPANVSGHPLIPMGTMGSDSARASCTAPILPADRRGDTVPSGYICTW